MKLRISLKGVWPVGECLQLYTRQDDAGEGSGAGQSRCTLFCRGGLVYSNRMLARSLPARVLLLSLFLLNGASVGIGISEALVSLGGCAISPRTVMNQVGWVSLR